MPQFRDISGHRFGKLTAIRVCGKNKNGSHLWLCKCECGGEKAVSVNHLRAGSVKSCGCLHHNLYKTPEYSSWHAMMARCYNENCAGYDRYGARGITVCERWRDVRNFYNDMHPRPVGTTLDRIDGNKGYFPDNCRWATAKEQNNNLESNRWVNVGGDRMTLAQLSRMSGLSHELLRKRLGDGMTPAEAIAKPVKAKHGKLLIRAFGLSKSMSDWSSLTGIPRGTLYTRIARGWSGEDALSRPVQEKRQLALSVDGADDDLGDEE